MQERQISDERKNSDIQEEPTEDKVAYKQGGNLSNIQSVNQENKKKDKQSFNLPDLGLSSALGLLTPDNTNKEEEQIPMKKKIQKKPKRGFRQS